MRGQTLAGDTLALADLGGQVVVLNAWGSWCAPCAEELPLLSSLAKRHEDVRFVGLVVRDNPAEALTMRNELGLASPSIVDQNGTILQSLPGVPPRAIPSTLVLDRQGAIAATFVGKITAGELQTVLAEPGYVEPARLTRHDASSGPRREGLGHGRRLELSGEKCAGFNAACRGNLEKNPQCRGRCVAAAVIAANGLSLRPRVWDISTHAGLLVAMVLVSEGQTWKHAGPPSSACFANSPSCSA
ncbi:MAG: TlpA family protein disulfide reductase [Actinomycetia bacterium]|nr:TlpA family protein disulfide reductase [Actinomycetes bacterium]